MVIGLVSAAQALGSVFSYECDSAPEDADWTVVQIVCQPDLWVDLCDPDLSVHNRCFFQHVELCEGYPPPGGQQATYMRTLDEFIGEDQFFAEWAVETDADRSEIPWGGGAGLGLGNNYGIGYTFDIARDQAKLNRDNSLPIIFVDLEPGVPHTHRLELYGADLYVWYVDGEIVDQGVPEGEFPSFDPIIIWRAKAAWLPNTTVWDYIRYGTIAADGSGDYDSDQDVDSDDFYFFEQYFFGPDVDAGPGGRFADFDFDTDVDCDDWQQFLLAWSDPPDPPDFPQCVEDEEPPAPIPAVSQAGVIVMTLLLGTALGVAFKQPRVRHRRTLNGQGKMD